MGAVAGPESIDFNLGCAHVGVTEGVNAGRIRPGTIERCQFALGAVCGLTVAAESGERPLIDYDQPVPATFVRRYDDAGGRVHTCPWAELYAGNAITGN